MTNSIITKLGLNPSDWRDNAVGVERTATLPSHPIFNTPMTIAEMADRYCELRLHPRRNETEETHAEMGAEMDALEYRLSLSKPESLKELHVLAQLLYVQRLTDHPKDNVYFCDREELNFIERIMEFAASAKPNSDESPATGSSTSKDPLTECGHELAKLHAMEAESEGQRYAEETQRLDGHQGSHSEGNLDRILALEAVASTTKATSPEGSLIQLALVTNELNALESYELDDAGKRRAFRTCFRMLFSIRDVLREVSAANLEEIAVDRYMDDCRNPWIATRRQVA